MNTERLLREIEKRLVGLPEAHRDQILDALREEISRERRRVPPAGTVETERERRVEAETLREVLEAINRHTNLDDTLSEVLKQLSKILVYDSCCLALTDAEGFRIAAVRGFREPAKAVGSLLRDRLSLTIQKDHWPVAVGDVQQDERYEAAPGCEGVRSWAGLPLLVEGEGLGLLCLQRHQIEPFDEEDLHRAKAVAFSAAAAIRKAQLHEHVRRYANLMERVVAVDQAVFRGEPREKLARIILEGALHVAGSAGGLLVLAGPGGPRIAAATGEGMEAAHGLPAPAALLAASPARLEAGALEAVSHALGLPGLPAQVFLVPLATPDTQVGCLTLLGRGSQPPNGTLMEAYASRATTAYLHAVRHP